MEVGVVMQVVTGRGRRHSGTKTSRERRSVVRGRGRMHLETGGGWGVMPLNKDA